MFCSRFPKEPDLEIALGWDLGEEGLMKQAVPENSYSGMHATPLLRGNSSKELKNSQQETYLSEEHKCVREEA